MSSSYGNREIYPNMSSYECDCCECGCEEGTTGAPNTTGYPVRYGDGQILISETDLSWAGFDMAWGHSRHYVNQLSANDAGVNGNSWLVRQLEYLAFVSESQICVVRSASASIWFLKVGDDWVAEMGVHATLVHEGSLDPGEGEYILFIEDTGRTLRFFDDDALMPPGRRGKLKAMEGAGGQEALLDYDEDGQLLEWFFAMEGRSTRFSYDYEDGRIANVTQSGDGVPLRRADYSYYGEDDMKGNAWDLETVVISQWDGAAWQPLRSSHYRYYVTEDPGDGDLGFVHGLRYLVGPEAYERMVVAGYPPEEAPVGVLRSYADNRFTYDTSKRVTLEAVRGGAYEETFSYDEATHAGGEATNHWKWKTVVSRPDGTILTAYSNHLFQTMLTQLKDGSDVWYDGTRFDDDSRVTKRVTSAAVQGVDEGLPQLFNIHSETGLVYVNTWNTTTFPGHLDLESVQQGEDTGSEIRLRAFTWGSHGSGSKEMVKKASETVYRSAASGGSSPATTSYAYTWHEDSFQIASVTTTLPTVPTSENGNNTSGVTTVSRFDLFGRPTWSKNELGYITRREHEGQADGRMSSLVTDVDTSLYGDVPAGWVTPAGGGLNLVTDFDYDSLGRLVQTLGPVHEIDDNGTARLVRTADWTAYQDLIRQTATASGMVWGEFPFLSHRRIGPVEVTRRDWAGRTVDRIRCVPETPDRPGSGDEYPQDTWTGWTSHSYDDQGFEVWQRAYHTIPASGAGLEGANFDQTDFGYDEMLRRNRTTSPGGTIQWDVHDARGNVVETWIGTDATGGTDADPDGVGAPNNMVLVSQNVFDEGESGGNNLLTSTIQHVSMAGTRTTSYTYDFRGRRINSTGPLGDYRQFGWDNRDNLITLLRRNPDASGTVRAVQTYAFDSRNRFYRNLIRGVDSAGTLIGTVTNDTWYDEAGRPIKKRAAGSRSWTKTVYDGAGRAIREYLCFRTSGTENATNSVTDNIVVQQTETDWDAGSNVIETRVLERFDDAGSTTGALVPPGASGPQGRRSTTCRWADGSGRPIATAAYGTAAGLTVERPALIPATSETVLVNLTDYDPSGRIERVTNPLGLETITAYDARDRVVLSAQNAGAADVSEMLVTEQSYSPDGALEILTLKNAVTGDQVTRWVYGTTLGDSGIATSNLLFAKVYPDNPLSLDPESPGGSDRVSYAYNRQSEVVKITDQTGTVRELDYDERGRLINDRVTTLGSGVDGAVRCISTGYDDLDRRILVTSWQGSSPSGTVVNQVAFTYSYLGQVASDRQEHAGTVDVDTPEVSYQYVNEGTDNLIRQTSMTYPDGRIVASQYNGNEANYLPRVTGFHDDLIVDEQIANYQYIGAGRVVTTTYPQVNVALVRKEQASGNVPSDSGPHDPYVGLDRFGRDIDHRWIKDGTTDLERIQYGYDAGSRRTWRRETVSPEQDQDEAYRYDGLSQVTQRQRGGLNLAATAIGTEVAGEAFDYDPAGNWQEYRAWDGDEELVQPRTYNTANEMKTFDGSGAVTAYDAAGRMTRVPMSENPLDGYFLLTWDAWSRLVQREQRVGDLVGVATRHEYDGLFRRTRTYGYSPYDKSSSYYYNTAWKVIEERVEEDGMVYTGQYVYGVRGRNDVILRDLWSEGGSSSSGGGEERLYALCDAMGSKTAIVSAGSSAVVERYGYSAFGMSRVMSAAFLDRATSHFDWQVRFHGEMRDAETGWYNYGYRYYNPQLGRWLSRDPIGELARATGFHDQSVEESPIKLIIKGVLADEGSRLTRVEHRIQLSDRHIDYRGLSSLDFSSSERSVYDSLDSMSALEPYVFVGNSAVGSFDEWGLISFKPPWFYDITPCPTRPLICGIEACVIQVFPDSWLPSDPVKLGGCLVATKAVYALKCALAGEMMSQMLCDEIAECYQKHW